MQMSAPILSVPLMGQDSIDPSIAPPPRNKKSKPELSPLDTLVDLAFAERKKLLTTEKKQQKELEKIRSEPNLEELLPYFCTQRPNEVHPERIVTMRTELLTFIDEIFDSKNLPTMLSNYLASKNLTYRRRNTIVTKPPLLHRLLQSCYDYSFVKMAAAIARIPQEGWGIPSMEQRAETSRAWLRDNADSITSLSISWGEAVCCIPKEVLKLPNLVSLDLRSQLIRAVPPCVGSAEKLTTLVLSHNKIASLPDSIKNLKALQELRLDGNRFTSVPGIASLSGLLFLDLSGNPIQDEPITVGRLKKQDLPRCIVYR